MSQKLAEQTSPDKKPEHHLKTNTQTYAVQQIWKHMKKTEFNQETDADRKVELKGELYTKISEIYEKKYGSKVKRSSIRRCVNALTIKAK